MKLTKFYYKGQLVRQSKTKDYNFAVIREKEDGAIVTWGCATNLAGAEKALKDARKVNAAYKVVALEKREAGK